MSRAARLALALALLASCSPVEPDEPADVRPGAPDGALAGGGASPWFADVTEAWGLGFTHVAGFSESKHLPETMGAGAVLADLDGDGDLDAYLVQGGPDCAAAARGAVPADAPPNRTFLNRGDGHFTDATGESGDAAHRGYGMGAVAGDVDGDGDQDLYATNLGADALLVNDGRARFRSPADNGGIRDERWTTGATFFDADADGDLDLFVTGYLEVDFEEPIWCGRQEPGWRSYCHPDRYAALQDRFWRNRGDGSFADETERAGFADSFGKGLGVIASDFDADGDQDLYVANDSTENRLWRNAGDGTFADDTLLSGTGVNEHGASEAGMGLATGDVDGDGDIDVLVSNLDHESNTLYRNLDGVLFEDATTRMGLEAPSRMFVGFGLVLEDFDQDGDLDLAVANGHIIDNIALYDQGQTWAQRGQLFVNDGRTLRENALAGGPLSGQFVARGLYAGDLDGDGHPDLLLTQCNAPARVFRNVRAGRGVTLRGLPQGARVTARTREGRALAREVGGRISYFGQGSDEVVLGLGAGDAVTSLSVREVGKEPVDVGVPEGLDGVRRLRRVGGGWELE